MITLAVLSTAGGAGATTLAAQAFTGLRASQIGAPTLLGTRTGGLVERAGGDEVPASNSQAAIWDGGVHSPAAAAQVLASGECRVVMVTPATDQGVAAAREFLDVAGKLGNPQLMERIGLVVNQVYRRTSPRSMNALLGMPTIRIPWSEPLARPGPLPRNSELSRKSRTAVENWMRYAAGALS